MLTRFKELKGKNRSDAEILIHIHHTIMQEYGWIPLEELKKVPNPMMFNLYDEIMEERKEIQKRMKHGTRRH